MKSRGKTEGKTRKTGVKMTCVQRRGISGIKSGLKKGIERGKVYYR